MYDEVTKIQTTLTTLWGGGSGRYFAYTDGSPNRNETTQGSNGSIKGIGAQGGFGALREWNMGSNAVGGGGGAGYGAGGGAGGIVNGVYDESNYWASSEKCAGGNSGEYKELSFELGSTAIINVTVGKKGERPQGESDGAGAGENGCVLVFW